MSNHDITRLVVGESISLSMGKPVGQTVKSTDVSKTLRYKDGQWESPASLLDITRRLTGTPATVLTIPVLPSKNTVVWPVRAIVLGVAAIIVAVFLTWLTMSMFGPQGQRQDADSTLPIGAKSPENKLVKSVNEPYLAQPSAPQDLSQTVVNPDAPAPGPNAPIPVPLVQGDAKPVGQPPVPAPAPAAQLAIKSGPPAQTKADTKADAKDQKQQPAAVVLDAEGPATKVTAPAAPAPKVAASAPAPQTNLGKGLVALTADGKFALFTNPKTRLPEKFGVGEKLPSGEVVKSIDKANSKVVTDAKEYRLE